MAPKKQNVARKSAKKQSPKTSLNLTEKQQGKILKPITLKALSLKQGTHQLYYFSAEASALFRALSINRKIPEKDEGYQRVLSSSRIQALKRFVLQKNALPGALIVCLEKAKYEPATNLLTIPAGVDVGWVVDGQHRLAAAELASRDGHSIELAVIAFIGLSEEAQIEQFVTINKEAKSVPSSLYLDLLKRLPNKRAADAPKERAADLASILRKDEESPFYSRIVSSSAPKDGQLSLVNFVRKVTPFLLPDRGLLSPYNEQDQVHILANYYLGLAQVFPDEFSQHSSIFFKTLGFGALMNVFPSFFTLTLKQQEGGFRVSDVAATFRAVESYSFDAWKQAGTGSQGELLAAEDLKTNLSWAYRSADEGQSSIKLS